MPPSPTKTESLTGADFPYPYRPYDRFQAGAITTSTLVLAAIGGIAILGYLRETAFVLGVALLIVSAVGGVLLICLLFWQTIFKFLILSDNERRRKWNRAQWYARNPDRPFPYDLPLDGDE